MKPESENYVVIFPDGKEIFIDYLSLKINLSYDLKQIANQAVRIRGLTRPRGVDKKICVIIQSLSITKGEVKRSIGSEIGIDLPVEALTSETFAIAEKELLSIIPEEFHGFVSQQAYDRGHSSGYDEVFQIEQEIVAELTPAIEKFRKISKKCK